MYLNGPSLYNNPYDDPLTYQNTWVTGNTAVDFGINANVESQIDFPETMYGDPYFTRTIDQFVAPETGLYHITVMINFRPANQPVGLDVMQGTVGITWEIIPGEDFVYEANNSLYYAYDNAYTLFSTMSYSVLCYVPVGHTLKCRFGNVSTVNKQIRITNNKQEPQPLDSARTSMVVQRIL